MLTMRKIWIIYKIITFHKFIRELRSQGNQRNGTQKSDKILPKKRRYTGCFAFGKAQREEVADKELRRSKLKF